MRLWRVFGLLEKRLIISQCLQKSSVDNRIRYLEFDVDDWVYLKIWPMKSVMMFLKKGKHSTRYVGSYHIWGIFVKFYMSLIFPTIYHQYIRYSMSVLDIWHLLFLWKVRELKRTFLWKGSDRYFRVTSHKLRNNEVAFIKVPWRNHLVEGYTFEAEVDMMYRYPQLFPSAPTLAWGI